MTNTTFDSWLPFVPIVSAVVESMAGPLSVASAAIKKFSHFVGFKSQ
jgi:hypothetical protein